MTAARPEQGTVTIRADGRDTRVVAGTTVAAALLDLGVAAFRRSASGAMRGPVCGMGTCWECRVTIDGVSHRRACLVVVAEGMRVDTASATGPTSAVPDAPTPGAVR